MTGKSLARPGRKRAPSVAARRAKGIRMLREGARIKDVAAALGVHRNTVKSWQKAEGLAEKVAAEIESEEQARARILEEARSRLAREVGSAVDVVIDVMHYRAADKLDGEGEPNPSEHLRADSRVAKVQLQAALAVLDRAGLPKVTETKHEGGALDVLAEHLRRAMAAEVGD